MQADFAGSQQQLTRKQAELTQAQQTLKAREGELKTLKQKLSASEERLAELAESSRECEQLRSELEQSEQALDAKQRELAEANERQKREHALWRQKIEVRILARGRAGLIDWCDRRCIRRFVTRTLSFRKRSRFARVCVC